MSNRKIYTHDNLLLLFSILSGLIIGMLITLFCLDYKLAILGVNISIFIAPLAAGFVETFVSMNLRKKSSGAISAIILFFVTNGIGWLFPSQPLTLNIFTVGGFILMLQAAFPLLINYLIIGIFLAFSYILGLLGSFIGSKFRRSFIGSKLRKHKEKVNVKDIEIVDELDIALFNSKPDFPVKEYHGLICAEDVIEFEEKNHEDRLEYIQSDLENKNIIKLRDYSNSRKYILHLLAEKAIELNANAIIDIEFEYTNYNQQIPPDVLIAAYGTAVTIDETYLN